MPKKNNYFLVLILLLLVNNGYGQSLTLKVEAESDLMTSVIDSINYKRSFDNYLNITSELDTLVYKLSRLGYIDTTLDSVIRKNDTLFKAQFYLGRKVKRIRIKYDSIFNTALLNYIDHTKGNTYFELDIKQLETSLDELNSKIAERGDPFSLLQLTSIRKQSDSLIAAELKIKTNQKRRIDKIIIKGYDKFPQSFLKRFLKLKKGTPLNLNDIEDKTELLNELRFANKIKDPEVLFTKDSTTLYLYIEKTPVNNFDGFLGFGTNENTNKIEFDGYLDLRLINNLNFGETLNLFYKSDEIDQQTFRIDTDLPFIFKSPVGLQLGLNIFRKDTTFSNASQYAKINYQINARHRVAIGISTTNSTNLLDNNTNILNDYTSNYYTLNYNFTKPQFYDPLFPINFWFNVSSGFGNRENNLGNQNQTTLNLETYKIFNLNPKNSIYTRIKGALLTSDNYLDNELFRFGGINSIRGFEENSLVANLYSVLNTEYRYRLSSSIYVHSVFDAAYFENQITDTKEKLFGFGFGLGLLTNAGLFRLNYSSGKSENRQFRLSDSKVHVSLTATF